MTTQNLKFKQPIIWSCLVLQSIPILRGLGVILNSYHQKSITVIHSMDWYEMINQQHIVNWCHERSWYQNFFFTYKKLQKYLHPHHSPPVWLGTWDLTQYRKHRRGATDSATNSSIPSVRARLRDVDGDVVDMVLGIWILPLLSKTEDQFDEIYKWMYAYYIIFIIIKCI